MQLLVLIVVEVEHFFFPNFFYLFQLKRKTAIQKLICEKKLKVEKLSPVKKWEKKGFLNSENSTFSSQEKNSINYSSQGFLAVGIHGCRYTSAWREDLKKSNGEIFPYHCSYLLKLCHRRSLLLNCCVLNTLVRVELCFL